MLNLGDEVTVKVDDIDNAGKLSLSLVGDEADGDGAEPYEDRPRRPRGGGRPERSDRERPERSDRGRPERSDRERPARSDGAVASFEDQWESEAQAEFGDLGPAETARTGGPGRRQRGRRQRRGGGRSRSRRRR